MPLYVTHVYAHSPHHLPKKVTQKQPVNHIGSSDEPPTTTKLIANLFRIKSLLQKHYPTSQKYVICTLIS